MKNRTRDLFFPSNPHIHFLILVALGAAVTACGDDLKGPSGGANTTDGGVDTDGGVTDPLIVVGSYETTDQMLLANEINESGEPFAESLGYDLDLLDPTKPGMPDDRAYVLGIENYEYSRYQLATVVRNSGIGLHLMWAPLVVQGAAASAAADPNFDGSITGTPNGFNEDDQLVMTLRMFSTLSNEIVPGHAWPQFAEFASGDPNLPQPVDAAKFDWEDVATMRWDRSKMDRHLHPAAMGQSLQKQYLWAQDMLGSFHNAADEGIEATGSNSPDLPNSPMFDPNNDIFYGGDARDGFIGMALTAQGLNKVAFLINALAFDGTNLGAIDLPAYDPAAGIRYFPHSIAVSEEMVLAGLPPRAANLTVADASSQLFDQASLLWGTTSFADMMNPTNTSDGAHLAYREVFDGSPFPASASETGTPGPYDLMKGTSRAIFLNLQAMHFDAAASVYVDESNLAAGGQVTRGNSVSALSSAYLIVALETFASAFDGTPLKAQAIAAIGNQANFMVTNLSDGAGVYFDNAIIGSGHSASQSLEAQSAAVRGLYVAARVTGDAGLKSAAAAAYAALIRDYWVSTAGLFRSDLSQDVAIYTPRNFAVLAGALREAALEGAVADASNIYVETFMKVGDLMQLSESANSGESGGDSDNDHIPFVPESGGLPPVFASQGTFKVTE